MFFNIKETHYIILFFVIFTSNLLKWKNIFIDHSKIITKKIPFNIFEFFYNLLSKLYSMLLYIRKFSLSHVYVCMLFFYNVLWKRKNVLIFLIIYFGSNRVCLRLYLKNKKFKYNFYNTLWFKIWKGTQNSFDIMYHHKIFNQCYYTNWELPNFFPIYEHLNSFLSLESIIYISS